MLPCCDIPGTPAARRSKEATIATTRTQTEAETALVPRSTGRILDLIEAVVDHDGCNLTTAAAATGLTPTTALRHLRALEARGYLARDASGDFSAGPRLLRLAAAVHGDGPLRRLTIAAQPHLDALAAGTGESTYLAIVDGDAATYVATAESDRAIRHVGWIGQSVPLEGTAVGAALAGDGAPASRTGAVEPDITAVACAVPTDGRLQAAISVIGPQHRVAERVAEIAAALEAATHELGVELGHPGESVAS